jgi:hypothetical protein
MHAVRMYSTLAEQEHTGELASRVNAAMVDTQYTDPLQYPS